MKWLKFAFLNVLRNRRRGVAAILIVAMGCSGILMGGGFALYTYDSLREMAARDKGHLILAHHDYFDQQEETPMAFGLSQFGRIRSALLKDSEIRAVLPTLAFTGMISNGDTTSIFVGNGIDPGEFKVKGPFLKVVHGASLSAKPPAELDPQVMIGEGLAKIMNAEVGDSLTLLSSTVEGSLNAVDVIVHGIFTLGVPEMDKRILLTDLSTAQSLLLTDKISTLSVYLFDTEQTDVVGAKIAAQYPELAIQTWLDMAFYYFSVRGLYNRIFGLLGFIILGMVFFAVVNVIAMSVVERTREIGTLRAMGTHPGEIVRHFILEALMIGFIGVSLAMILASTAALGLSLSGLQMPPPPARSQGYPLVIYVDAHLYASTAVFVLLLCVVAAFLASRKAAQKPIVEALSHV